MLRLFAVLCLFLVIVPSSVRAEAPDDMLELSWQMFWQQGDKKREVINQLAATGDKSLIPTLVLAMRWTRNNIYVARALSELTGETISDWHEAYVWQERNPQIVPHETFRAIKLRFLGNTDKRFLDFFNTPFGTREKMKIRLEEISWGGARYDTIPSLDQPDMITARQADYLLDTDLVFGVEINGDARAYPLRIMGWHEMMNDVVGGVPVALAYCTLCGAGILFETRFEGQDAPYVFGSSGLLYRSNKLMFDRTTNSLWNQFTGEPVVGPLAHSSKKLNILPMSITTWKAWRGSHPDTLVLSLETGHIRNYDSGFVYRDYFASPDLMFPAAIGDESLLVRKDYVFGIRDVGAARAWPIEAFGKNPVINDVVGTQSVVLIGNADTRTVRAYSRKPEEAFSEAGPGRLISEMGNWQITEDALVLQGSGEKRPRIPGHVSYWFAWDNYMGVQSTLYGE